MKSKILFYIAVGLAFLTVSCDSYLDKAVSYTHLTLPTTSRV